MNASAESRTYKLAWPPLFCAVCYKNIGTLQELWDDGDELEVKEQQDVRGWNLLHVAAGYGKFEAVPYLLEQCVSLEAISKPASRLVPPSVRGRSVTPAEVARSCGEAAYSQ
jgi:ankyrin repeat protein